eukprot:PhM_4_TR16193/c0_g1_i1/m.68861/K15423/PPP4C; serine/threonine-protein phosphatase 4 catalytic subunit
MPSLSLDRLFDSLSQGNLIKESDVVELCRTAQSIVSAEDNMRKVSAPLSIVGDIHGQFYDLLEVFYVVGTVPETNYVFLGDYVDRGLHSVETFLLLLVLKCKYPLRVTLVRGNHETRHLTQVYGFYDECLRKYGSVNVWRACTN